MDERRRALFSEYELVIASHDKITDFRAKLLALLPIASGAGIGFLIAQTEGDISKTSAALLVALGVFGFLVTVGLFFYEVRQIDVCKQLRNRARFLECAMGMGAAQFSARRPPLSLREMYRLKKVGKPRDKELRDAETEGKSHEIGDPEGLPLLRSRMIGAETAGYVVYHSVMASWLFVLAVGAWKL
jgi:hypothetical protein